LFLGVDIFQKEKHGMDRTEITAAIVRKIERMLAQGTDHATIAATLGITQYVVWVIANDKLRCEGYPPQQQIVSHRNPNAQKALDATTIRMIQRMLDVGILPKLEIARQAGVSANMVSRVAKGKRQPITLLKPHLQEGERFLSQPIRCNSCGGLISVAPCRACATPRKIFVKNIFDACEGF
jgi:hypothetical protein